MGAKDFFKIKYNGKTITVIGREITLKKLKGSFVCIDASLMIYTTVLAIEKMQGLTDESGNITAHINIIFQKIIQLTEAGIAQLWIFDSPTANHMKTVALKRREARRKTAETAEITEEQRQKRQYKLNETHVNEIKDLLNYMGIRWIEAPAGIEAEQYGAFLTRGEPDSRFCKYMITTDSDLLLFGGNMLRIGSVKTGKSKRTAYFEFELQDILNEIDVTYDELVKAGVVLGTDFNDKTPGIGPATVISKVKNDKVYYTPAQLEAINYFKSNIGEEVAASDIHVNIYDRNKVIEFLKSRSFSVERVNKRLDVYEKFNKPVAINN